MDEDGDVSRVVQVKGKANRLPGWDAGKTGMGKMKRGEVEMANEFLEHIGFINIDEIGDMRPGMRALKGLKENPPAIEEEIDCPVCGLHDVVPGSKSFCEPVG